MCILLIFTFHFSLQLHVALKTQIEDIYLWFILYLDICAVSNQNLPVFSCPGKIYNVNWKTASQWLHFLCLLLIFTSSVDIVLEKL